VKHLRECEIVHRDLLMTETHLNDSLSPLTGLAEVADISVPYMTCTTFLDYSCSHQCLESGNCDR
jgi:hypothetical protein